MGVQAPPLRVRPPLARPKANPTTWLGHLVLVVTLAGWLHVIWNGEPRVMLVDDQGSARPLIIADGLVQPLGGLRALNQRRVVITGEPESGPPEVVRVLTIQLQPESR
jgi:hypothetical protein